jgi:copper oxidase (laccase) domain-containing protein
MALASVASGSQVCTVTTEHTLSTQTTAKTFLLMVDLGPAVNGDVFEVRVKTKVLSTSTSRLAYYAAYAHVQAQPNKYSIPVPSMHECIVTLKQAAGTSRTIDWNLVTLD